MSLYYKENPQHLREALDSIFSQTVLSDDVVLLEDGIVGELLETVVVEYEQRYPQLHVKRYKQNRGLGYALNAGIKERRHGLEARMDTEDGAQTDPMV